MLKNKQKVMRNNSNRYSTHNGHNDVGQLKGMFQNLPTLNHNSAFGTNIDSSDDEEQGKRSFTQEVNYANKRFA